MKIKVSEIFYSVQGEGRFVGVPSVFLRTFGCNFTCSGFGCEPGKTSKEADKIAKNISQYKTLADVPLAKTGCDSFISWHPAFKDLSPNYETEELVTSMKSTIPNNSWLQPNGNEVHLVITGGEPLLGWQRAYTELLEQPGMRNLNNITFETNGTQKLIPAFSSYLNKWVNTVSTPGYARDITFSVSPKLSASGEAWKSAIIPNVVVQYQDYGFTYLKFVVENEQHVEEALRATEEYRKAGFMGPVYLMPEGGTKKSYEKNLVKISELCMKYGLLLSPRLHVSIFGNQWAT